MSRVLCALLLTLAAAAPQWGEQEKITVDVDLVNVYFTVCNGKGKLVPNLDRESFAVFEDGAPQTITHFSREADVPLTIAMVIDTSGSVREKLSFEQRAAAEFLFATLQRGRDKAALFTFDHVIELRQDYTDDVELLDEKLKRIRAGGGTRVYDALQFALEQKLAGPEERKIIVLISDGEDKSSRSSPREIVELAQRNDVTIYAISMNSLGVRRDKLDQSDTALAFLASETGGTAYFPTKLEKLSRNFKDIAQELRSQYTIGYRSTNPKRDGAFREIRIESKKSRYAVRTRPGYYAPLLAQKD
jgi:VWFA-related protein